MTARFIRVLVALVLAGVSMASQALVLAINEGVTYRVSNDEIRAKYAWLAADLAKILKQPVNVEPVADYPSLRQGLAAREFDLAFVHPTHLAVLAIRDSGYRLLAVTKGYQNYTANFLVKADSSLKTLTDLRGLTVGAPDEDSITSWMVRATLRDAFGGAQPVKYAYTRYQDAVPFFVDHQLAVAGATASGSVIKAWQAKGGKVLGTSKPVPIKDLIAGPALSAEQVQKVREYLVTLDASEEGRRKLETLKYEGFAPFSQADLLAIGKWLGL